MLTTSTSRISRRQDAGQHTFAVHWCVPLDIPASVEEFRRPGEDLIDRWDGRVVVRTARLEGMVVPYVCQVTGAIEAATVEVTVGHEADAAGVEAVVRGMFVTATEPLAALVSADPVIARLDRQFPGVRPVLQTDLFTALIRSISAQQVNLAWAATTRRRLVEAFGTQHRLGHYRVFSLEAERLASAKVAELRALQFTTRKAECITTLAGAVADGSLGLEELRGALDTEVIRRLTALRGIGRWTAEWFLARALGRPCVAAGDLGVRKAIGAVYLQGRMPSEAEVRECTAHWGAAAGVAQQLVLQALRAGVVFT
ncbi:hypothetical protein NKDENANG_01865 [Candidatus Entotheonellaceae bacterium PAL068K]